MQWWQTHLTTEVGFTAGQLVILDETSLAGTLWLATMIASLPSTAMASSASSVELGYAVTSFRAQGLTTDTAHVLVDSNMTRETLYVAMTRGRDANVAYVAVDKPDATHGEPHPGDGDGVTGG